MDDQNGVSFYKWLVMRMQDSCACPFTWSFIHIVMLYVQGCLVKCIIASTRGNLPTSYCRAQFPKWEFVPLCFLLACILLFISLYKFEKSVAAFLCGHLLHTLHKLVLVKHGEFFKVQRWPSFLFGVLAYASWYLIIKKCEQENGLNIGKCRISLLMCYSGSCWIRSLLVLYMFFMEDYEIM